MAKLDDSSSGLRGTAPRPGLARTRLLCRRRRSALAGACLGLLSRLSRELVLAALLLRGDAETEGLPPPPPDAPPLLILCSSSRGPRLEDLWLLFLTLCWMS